MCGIAGYIGRKKRLGFLLQTLQRLEYRGYDSCGFAVKDDSRINLKKVKGKIKSLESAVNLNAYFTLGIAHTRWATHGAPSFVNAHPHYDCGKKIFVVHNGIVENYRELKSYLKKRHHNLRSDTDTEVIPHLIEEFCQRYSFFEAFLKAVNMLKGSFAISAITVSEEELFFARKDSPLIMGIAKDGFILASDIPAVIPFTKNIVHLKDGWVGRASCDKFEIFNFKKEKVKAVAEKTDVSSADATKQHYAHFMLKEIYEQPRVCARLYSSYVRGNGIDFRDLGIPAEFLKSLKRIFIFACGSAYHAGFVAKYFLEQICDIEVEIDVSSEARYRRLKIGPRDLVLAVSQSGETADTIAALREAKKKKAKVIGVCNVLGSTIADESDGLIYTLAGPEIGVASTKAYTAQVFSLLLFSLHLAHLRKSISASFFKQYLSELKSVSEYHEAILAKVSSIKRIAKRFSSFGCFLFLGRGINYPSALEGALKLKEISYIPAEGYPAGEMKHGPIALIDEYRAVVCIAPKDELYPKVISNIQEIKARKAKVLAIVDEKGKEAQSLADAVIHIPCTEHSQISPLLVALPLQLFAYFVANNLGCEIDQPRNLAKSVTVE